MEDEAKTQGQLIEELRAARRRIREMQAQEAARREAADSPLAEHNLLQTLLDNTIDFIYVKDAQSRFILSSLAHLRSMGRAHLEDVRGKTDLELFPPDLGQTFYDDEQNLLRTGDPLINKEEMSLNERGERMWASTTKVPLRDAEGNVVGLMGITRDITKQKRAEAEREQLIAELEAFSHTVAHDLKSPLNALVGYAEELVEDLEMMSADEIDHVYRAILRVGRKMSNIVDELLLLANVRRLDNARALEMCKPLEMEQIVQEARERLVRIIEDCRAEIVLPDAWPAASGYGPWVEEVWVNYLSNAIKYSSEYTPTPRIELGAEAEKGGKVRFWVRDNGPGIAPEDQEKLFMPFTRLHRTRAEGHGLGLSIVQRIVEKLGGEVGVESTLGEGSTFSFTLPHLER